MSASVLRTGQASEAFGGQSRSTCLGFANPAESSATSPTNVLKRSVLLCLGTSGPCRPCDWGAP